MKIDLHCHTKKCKKGDSEGRNVSIKKFKEKVNEVGLKIVAITNHNCFDFEQFLELKESVKDFCNVWPGIELDVKQIGPNSGHVIVICDPKKSEKFNEIIQSFIDNNPDDFYISIDKLIESFNGLDVVYIAHYFKSHHLSDEDIEYFQTHLTQKTRFLKETSALTSLGIINFNGENGVIGSDVKNWDEYEKCQFAELKYSFIGYNNFLKLLDKNIPFVKDLIENDFYDCITVYGDHKKANILLNYVFITMSI